MMEEDRRLRASLLGACWENLHDGAVGWLCPLAPGCGRHPMGEALGVRAAGAGTFTWLSNAFWYSNHDLRECGPKEYKFTDRTAALLASNQALTPRAAE